MIGNILKKVFGSRNSRLIKEYSSNVKKINELDPNFMKHEKYLLEHLPKEMRVILDLCLHIL